MAAARTGDLKLGALFTLLVGAYAVASWLDLGQLLKPEQIVTAI